MCQRVVIPSLGGGLFWPLGLSVGERDRGPGGLRPVDTCIGGLLPPGRQAEAKGWDGSCLQPVLSGPCGGSCCPDPDCLRRVPVQGCPRWATGGPRGTRQTGSTIQKQETT